MLAAAAAVTRVLGAWNDYDCLDLGLSFIRLESSAPVCFSYTFMSVRLHCRSRASAAAALANHASIVNRRPINGQEACYLN